MRAGGRAAGVGGRCGEVNVTIGRGAPTLRDLAAIAQTEPMARATKRHTDDGHPSTLQIANTPDFYARAGAHMVPQSSRAWDALNDCHTSVGTALYIGLESTTCNVTK